LKVFNFRIFYLIGDIIWFDMESQQEILADACVSGFFALESVEKFFKGGGCI
jgi:hypothetical protein